MRREAVALVCLFVSQQTRLASAERNGAALFTCHDAGELSFSQSKETTFIVTPSINHQLLRSRTFNTSSISTTFTYSFPYNGGSCKQGATARLRSKGPQHAAHRQAPTSKAPLGALLCCEVMGCAEPSSCCKSLPLEISLQN